MLRGSLERVAQKDADRYASFWATRSTRYIGVLGSHRYKVVLGLAQLGGPPSGRVGPRPSGHWQSTFPDTFEPERFRASQCEGFQLEHQSPPKLCFAEGRVTIIHLAAARAPWLHAARMPSVVTSEGTTLGELILTRQQHSIARSASGPGTDTMVSHGRCGSSRGEEAGDLPKLSSTDGWWYVA